MIGPEVSGRVRGISPALVDLRCFVKYEAKNDDMGSDVIEFPNRPPFTFTLGGIWSATEVADVGGEVRSVGGGW